MFPTCRTAEAALVSGRDAAPFLTHRRGAGPFARPPVRSILGALASRAQPEFAW